jgi:hypothetical protein
MRVFVPILLAGVSLLAGCATTETGSTTSEPGLFSWMWNASYKINPFASRPAQQTKENEPERGGVNLKTLAMQVVVTPTAPKLSEDRVITVSIRISNKAKHRAQLAFSTSQRVEALIKDKSGRIIERWSEDHRFEQEPGVVSINPGERAEYNLSVATREMAVGEKYTVEAYVFGHEGLHGSAVVTPQK